MLTSSCRQRSITSAAPSCTTSVEAAGEAGGSSCDAVGGCDAVGDCDGGGGCDGARGGVDGPTFARFLRLNESVRREGEAGGWEPGILEGDGDL